MWLGLAITMITMLVGSSLVGAAGPENNRVAAATPSPTPRVLGGSVLGASVNVRSQPGLTATIVGRLRRGQRVQITRQRTGWLEIAFPLGSNRRGWVSAPLIAVDGQRARATATPTPAVVPAPVVRDYRPPEFVWSWNGQNSVNGLDWYFDILLFQGSNNQPYDTIAVNESQATQQNGEFSFPGQAEIKCDATWAMAIAQRKNGAWAGWVSPMSNTMKIGQPCDCDDPCPGCGDGGCAD
jgi:hypothetical protein